VDSLRPCQSSASYTLEDSFVPNLPLHVRICWFESGGMVNVGPSHICINSVWSTRAHYFAGLPPLHRIRIGSPSDTPHVKFYF
jgi:hypothetical protein